MWCYFMLSSTTQHYEVLLRTTKYYTSTTVLHSTTPVLQSTTPYDKVLRQYYSVLQSTTRVLLRTTKYYSSTTPYYKVLLRTTRYYASTTKYYKVLLQYYEVLRKPVLLHYYKILLYSVLLRTTPYYKVLLQYYSVLRQYYSVLQSTAPVLQSTTPYYKVPIQYYKVLRQYYKVVLCTTSYYASTTPVLQSTTPVLQSTTPSSAPATKSDTWASPNIAPVKQNDSHAWSWSHMKRHLQCAEQQVSPSNSPNTAPATQNDSHAWSSSHMKRHLQCAEQQVSPSNLTKYCACHTEWLACLIVVTYETSFTMRGATGVTIQPHQILRLPHRMTRMLDRRHIWNVIYNARSNRCHHPTSPNTAPATQNDSTALSSSHMKRHLQCAEQQVSLSNLTKYCACHQKWHCKISEKISKNRWNVISNAGTIREWSENDPTMIREWSENETVSPQPASQPRLLFELTTSIFYCKIQRFAPNLTFKHSPSAAPATKSQQVSRSNLTKYCACHAERLAYLVLITYETSFTVRGATGVTIQPHQILRLSRRKTRILSPHHIWNVIYSARSNRCHDPTSPNTAPVTQKDSHT